MNNGPITCCRGCGAPRGDLLPVLDLGSTPLANALLDREDLDRPEPRYPLELVLCPHCTLVQITYTVPPAELFSHYLYYSSFSSGILAHAEALVNQMIPARQLHGGSLVVEVASNDGYLLQYYRQRGITTLGIEPAENIAQVAREQRGIETISEFFSRDLAQGLRAAGRAADAIHAHNVLAHVADLHGVIQGIATLLKDDGVAVIEAPYVGDMIDGAEFDTIYHEHLCYFSLTALHRLFSRHGLHVADVQSTPIHGGSLRVMVQHGRAASPRVTQWLARENQRGMDRIAFYQPFAARVQSLRDELCRLLETLKKQGKSVAVYGASAKGSTLLNYCRINGGTLDFVADRSTVKQGRYTPGTHLPIVPPHMLCERRPDYTLLLTWNFKDEILDQQRDYRAAGGKFIVPIPEVHVI